ncbi:MAG: gamma-glutamyltransferase family protein [Chloroflexota bacterium]
MTTFNWDFPYASQRMPVLAKNVVATSQPVAAQAGLRMLLKGGNAVDAALAAAMALTVVEPSMNGIGSDAFAILWDGQQLHGLNASGRSPKALTYDHFAGRSEMPAMGWDTVTVPGCVSAWVNLSERFGKLAFAELFEPAIDYAQNGYLVSPITGKGWAGAVNKYRDFPEFADGFLPQGKAPAIGSRFRFPDQAKTLQAIASTMGEAFYQGDLAEKIAAHAQATGGKMTKQDLADHQVDWVTPIATDYRGLTLHEIPPNGQGLAALLMLGILRHFDLAEYPVDSADSIHLQLEAMKLAFADAHRYISDPATMDVSVDALLDEAYLARRAEFIDLNEAKIPEFGIPSEGNTVYLTAADESGMMISFIQSNYMGFGSGIVVPGTGISMQNRGAGFTLEPGHPNQIGGGKRPYHTIIPGFITENSQPIMSFGVMGGPMQPQGHAQMMIRLRDYGQNPQAASDAPRWRVVDGLAVEIEPGLEAGVYAELERRGHQIVIQPNPGGFGGAQLIHRLDNGYCAASDHRKDGQAVGF